MSELSEIGGKGIRGEPEIWVIVSGQRLAKKSYEIYQSDTEMGIFPEYDLLKLGVDYSRCPATIHEADNHEVNKIVADYLLKKVEEPG